MWAEMHCQVVVYRVWVDALDAAERQQRRATSFQRVVCETNCVTNKLMLRICRLGGVLFQLARFLCDERNRMSVLALLHCLATPHQPFEQPT